MLTLVLVPSAGFANSALKPPSTSVTLAGTPFGVMMLTVTFPVSRGGGLLVTVVALLLVEGVPPPFVGEVPLLLHAVTVVTSRKATNNPIRLGIA
jgi:hypothetical protein